jgi:hypothetical protein
MPPCSPLLPAANSGRTLLQQYSTGPFPYCRCQDYSTNSSPYFLTGPSTASLSDGAERVCFTMNTRPCATNLEVRNGTSCCSLLSASLHKLAFETSYSCWTSRAFFDVTVNGAPQNFDVSDGWLLPLTAANTLTCCVSCLHAESPALCTCPPQPIPCLWDVLCTLCPGHGQGQPLPHGYHITSPPCASLRALMHCSTSGSRATLTSLSSASAPSTGTSPLPLAWWVVYLICCSTDFIGS